MEGRMSVTITRRRFLAAGAGALAARPLLLAPAHGQPAIKVGTAVLGDYALAGPFILAGERGFFKTEGAAHKISGALMSHDGTVSLEALGTIQQVLLEHGVVKKKLPLEEHVAREFTPVRLT
jgi:hypothetical protein